MPNLDAFIDTSWMSGDIKAIVTAAPLPSLDDSVRCAKTAEAVEQYLVQGKRQCSLIGAGLWLLAGELDRSHTISQSYHSGDGAYWHGIMHRREGDFWNSKYWFQKASEHPIRRQLSELVRVHGEQLSEHDLPLTNLFEQSQVAESLSDLASESIAKNSPWKSDLQLVCWWEWQLLMSHCGHCD